MTPPPAPQVYYMYIAYVSKSLENGKHGGFIKQRSVFFGGLWRIEVAGIAGKKEIQNPSKQPSNVFFAWAYVGAT